MFQGLQGTPLGTVVWATRIETFAGMIDQTDPVAQSDEYLEQVEQAAQYFTGPAEDTVLQIVHQAGEVEGPPNAVATVQATVEVDRIASAVGWAIDLADHTQAVSGNATVVATANAGTYGTITWLTHASSLATLEAGTNAVNGDPGFLHRLSLSGGLFVPGSGHGTIARRIA